MKNQKKTKPLTAHQRFFDICQSWNDDFIAFYQNQKDFLLNWSSNVIEHSFIEAWLEEWEKQIVYIEAHFLRLFEGAKAGTVSIQTFITSSKALQKMKGDIDNFYVNHRGFIFMKHAFTIDATKKEALEVESELFAIRESFVTNLLFRKA